MISDEHHIENAIVFNDQNNVYILDTEAESNLDIPIFESISSGSEVSVSFDVTVIENAYVVIQLQGAGLNEQYVIEGDEAFETVSFSGKATTIGAVELSIFDVGGTGSVEVSNINAKAIPRGNVIQRDDYYPFGLTFNSVTPSNENLYKYNGFEEQQETGWFDYQARYYDPSLGRFLQVDPLADAMRRHSPYNYAFDNPIRYIDPDGMGPTTGDQDEEKQQQDEQEVEKEKQGDEQQEPKKEDSEKKDESWLDKSVNGKLSTYYALKASSQYIYQHVKKFLSDVFEEPKKPSPELVDGKSDTDSPDPQYEIDIGNLDPQLAVKETLGM